MTAFLEALEKLEVFGSVTKDAENNLLPLAVTGLSDVHKVSFISAICEKLNRRALIITDTEGTASKMQTDLNALSGGAYLIPAKDFSPAGIDAQSREYEHRRLGVLEKICEKDYHFIILSAASAVQLTLPQCELKKRTSTIRRAQDITQQKLIDILLKAGYVRSDLVDGVSQFSKRGDIVDFYPPQSEEPVRVDFWGDTIESIYRFSSTDQRRTAVLSSAEIVPVLETLFDSPEALAEKLETLLHNIARTKNEKAKLNIRNDIEKLKGGIRPAAEKYLPIAYSHLESVFDYCENDLLFVCESAKVQKSCKDSNALLNEDIKSYFENGILAKGLDKFTLSANETNEIFSSRGAVFLDTLPRGSYSVKLKGLYSVSAQTLPLWHGNIAQLTEDVAGFTVTKAKCAVMAGTPKNAKAVFNDLISDGVNAVYFPEIPSAFPRGTISVINGSLSSGFCYPKADFYLYSQGRAETQTTKSSKNRRHRAGEIHSLEDIYPGDYIVHNIHGIGIYDGVFPVETHGITKDYIKISYAKGDTLYVPVTQLDLVSKYIGAAENSRVKINSLGSGEWQKAKSRAKSGIKNIAKDLVELYAKRMRTKGFAFSRDGELQREFEIRFPYEETDDQIKCTTEIKRDMRSPHPMDRLLCGDVGFGKTEVALRAAFKCMADGKQVAMLVPTTILAMQHYQTISARMENFALSIEMLSRFRTAAEQKKIKDGLKKGTVDMVVGTHKLISKDITFHDLGLLIIDEEQRFGVAQKEKLKANFPDVDVLTLSATPIPRTLNMAMSGIRDMSVIEEAPQDRHPIQTYVLEFDFDILCEAIRKELRRGGQVYYLHNRVEDIESTVNRLHSEIPEAKIGVAHGKMNEKQLSEIWQKLLTGDIDILVCTTIIETGVDVPNVNTLIIENADHMGLAQLHQIRGRVGRSSRRASAYLTYRSSMELSEVATRRLEAVKEYTEFGSGFKIAMRDLEIRGAGNLLGAQQHGQMEAVGYDMYVKLLSKAIAEEKGEKEEDEAECLVDLPITAHISEKYIQSVPQRIGIYRRIADIRTESDARDVIDELTDRYGTPDSTVTGLIEISLLRALAAKSGVYEITQNGLCAILKVSDVDLYVIPVLQQELKRVIQINANNNKPFISIKLIKGDNLIETVKRALEIIQRRKQEEEKKNEGEKNA